MVTMPMDATRGDALAVSAAVDQGQIAAYERDGRNLLAKVEGVTITDQDSYNCCAALGQEAARQEKNWAEWIERPYRVVYAAYQQIQGLKKSVGDTFAGAKRLAGQKVAQWDAEQEQLRRQEERRMAELQAQEEADRKIAAAAQAEQAGMSEQAVEQILNEQSVAPRPIAAPTYQRAAGTSVRDNWSGEVTDFHALVKAAAKNKMLLPLLQINQPALNSQARIHKAALADVVPGTRGVNKGAVAFSR
ncbi:MAG: hypothetical protein ACRD8A_08800 [Candidatus Acidiferrales bacterium]